MRTVWLGLVLFFTIALIASSAEGVSVRTTLRERARLREWARADESDAALVLLSSRVGSNTDGTAAANIHEIAQAKQSALDELSALTKQKAEDVNSAAESAQHDVGDQQATEESAIADVEESSKAAQTEAEQAQEEALSNAKEQALTRLKVTEDMAESWEQEVSGRVDEKQKQAQEQLKAAQEASQARIEAKKEELIERFKAAEQLASVEREEQDRAAMTRLQAQLDLGTAEKLTLESFTKRADAQVQLAETEGQTTVNGEVGVSAQEQQRLDMDQSAAEKLGSDLEQEHNTVVHAAVLETAEMQAQTKKQLETLQAEKDAEVAQANAAAAEDQKAIVDSATQSALATTMQNVQLAANLQQATLLNGAAARRPMWI